MTRRARTSSKRTDRRLTDRGLVLRRFPYGESSLVVHLLTPAHGRVALLAKGAYRMKSGFFGVLDLFDTLELAWSPSRSAELGILAGASVEVRRRALSADLGRFRAGTAVLELARLGAREGQGDPELFALTEGLLEVLARTDVAPDVALLAYDLRFLGAMGLAPALEACASCGQVERPRDPARVPFSYARGGRLCAACAAAERAAGRRLEEQPLKWMRIARSLLDPRLAHLARIRLEPEAVAGVRALVERFLEYHLESPLKTRRSARGRLERRAGPGRRHATRGRGDRARRPPR